ncbi:putative porin [Hephaestia caeni]|uniref:Putative porin n=1 Tax=Hephaestia caeni TaxID=645617 RepID=A0A397PEI2_9SPHN|nr:putative porin [Hephaestia caeni]RIA46329.1 putative porin [Hephaestia caeni]
MLHRVRCAKIGAKLLATAALTSFFGIQPVFGQEAQGQVAQPDSAVATMVKLLVDEGIVTPEKGEALMRRAEAEAAQRATAAPLAQAAELAAPPAGAVRVPYVPETVRAQIKDELRQEVLAQARTERWAAPEQAAPDWTRNIRINGDFRFRSASHFYGRDNALAHYIDVPAFNDGGPYDISGFGGQLLPTINTTRDKRNNMQLRGRINLEATVAERFQVGFQLATGDDPGPISTNSGLTGGFRKRDVWIQNAYVRGELVPGLTAMLGRFDNPFRTTDLMFDPDLAFDGVYGEANLTRLLGHDDFRFAVRGGAFPIQFEPENFPSTSLGKRNWRDRYLFSAQVELGKTFAGGIDVNLSAAYHNFTYLRGHVSEPCDVFSASNVECSTDLLRPLWASKGNTLMFLRDIDFSFADPSNPLQPQYLGLKFAYRVLDVNGSVSVPISDRVQARLTGSYLHNFGFDPKNNCLRGSLGAPVTNVEITDPTNPQQGACDATNPARFVGGNEGYGVYFSLGDPNLFSINPRRARRGAWAINAAYKYLQSDAVPDSFTDSDFHLGGTNTKGYVLGAAWAPFDRISLGARWFSSNTIVDAPLAIDVFFVDLGLAF